MEIDKLKKIIFANKNVSVQHLKQLSAKLTEETTNTSVVSDLPKLIPIVFKYTVHENKQFRESSLPALSELAGLLDLNKHLKEKPWWTETKGDILKNVDMLMSLVSTGDSQWADLWMTTVMMLGSDLRSELTLLNKLLKVVEKAFKMNDEEVRHQGFECWCKLIDNFSINKNEINNKRKLALLVIPLKANNHNTPRLCASKMKTWKHLLSKLDQHNEMTIQLLVSHFLDFMFSGVGSIPPACKTLNTECANVFAQMLQTPLLFRILPKLFIKHVFVCIEHIHRDLTLCTTIWERLLDNMKNNQWAEDTVSELMIHLFNASKNDKLSKSKTFAYMVRMLYAGSHTLPSSTLVNNLKIVISLVLEPHVLINFTEEWCNELLKIVAETDPIQLPRNIVGEIITKMNVLSVSELFRDEKLKFLRGMWMTMTNMICQWMAEDGQIGKDGNEDTDLHNIHCLLFFGAAPLSSTWNKLQMKSWKNFYSECVKYFSLSTEIKCEKFVSDLVELLLEGVKDKKIPLHVALDLVSIILECHQSKDESRVLQLMTEVAATTMNSFQSDTTGTLATLNQYIKIILTVARSEPGLVNGLLTITDKMLSSLENAPLVIGPLEKTKNAILKAQIQLNGLKPCRSQDRSESPGITQAPATSPTMTSFLHRLAKSKETKSKVSSPTPSQSSEVSSSPSHTPNSKKSSSPFCDMKSEDFVFVPPKPRRILLTDHQKESLTTRKHDIPALYQDLSQDSSQSPFESIVTPVQVVDKEEKVEKATTINSPQSFKEVNFRRLSPRKSVNEDLKSSSSEDKLLNNKENDSVNNNKRSNLRVNLKEILFSQETEKNPSESAQEDQKDKQDHVPENVEDYKLKSPNTRAGSQKNLPNNSSSNKNSKENVEVSLCGLQSSSQELDTDCNDVVIKSKNIAQAEENVNFTDNKKETENLDQNLITPKLSSIEVITPKRSLRKKKLNISIEKSDKKNMHKNESEEQNLKDKLNLAVSNNSPKSLRSAKKITPKVSPIRLRKRKSGITPVLSSEIKRRVQKTKGLLNSKDTTSDPSASNNITPLSFKNDSLILNDETKETVSQPEKKVENIIVSDSCTSTGGTINRKNTDTIEVESITDRMLAIEDSVVKSTTSTETKSKFIQDNGRIEKKVVEIQENKLSSTDGEEVGVTKMDTECKQVSSRSISVLIDDIIDPSVGFSPVKVVVERLPDIITRPKLSQIVASSNESANKVDDNKGTLVINMNQTLCLSNCKSSSSQEDNNITDKTLLVKEGERKETSSLMKDTDFTSYDLCNENGNKEKIENLKNPNNVDDKNKICEMKGGENEKLIKDNIIVENIQLDSGNMIRKTRSMDQVQSQSENLKIDTHSRDMLDSDQILSAENNLCSTDTENSGGKITCSFDLLKLARVSLSKITETSDFPNHTSTSSKPKSSENTPTKSGHISTSSKPKSSENTPIKSGHKNLKQTQLPFTPIRKTDVPNSDSCSESKLSKAQNSLSKSPLLCIVKMGTEEINKALHSPILEDKTDNVVESEHIVDKTNKQKNTPEEANVDEIVSDNVVESELIVEKTSKQKNTNKEADVDEMVSDNVVESEPTVNKTNKQKNTNEEADVDERVSGNVSDTRQVERTPEKVVKSNNLAISLTNTEDNEVQNSNGASPNQSNESEDMIPSSQETNVTTQSILLSYRSSSSSKSLQLLSKSPKKCENPPQLINSTDRVLRSSPVKTENSRLTGTPVKKSVCRRLDVEIEESPESNEVDSLSTKIEEKSVCDKNSEELSNDFKLLNGHCESNTKFQNLHDPSSKEAEVNDNIVDNIYSDSSPRTRKSLKRFIVDQPDSNNIGSPKRTMGSLRFESNSSPMSSPNSRTSQMIELAKQDSERTISSPGGSSKKRRILPVRVGPVTRTPKSLVIHRSHQGPSEEWIRRTYSPTASPNSSILKRCQPPVSPDCSPPSSKKKRVSFLDPPVSESLLFSKTVPGKGQVQRPEQKSETESEEMTQGSVGVEPAETFNSEAKVFSPLKQCVSPLSDILERIVNPLWMSELEVQLERLGVTTVGQLSSLPEETVQRLPFIPPKLERLRKILQNYYNEINEKPTDSRPPLCPETKQDDCLSPGKDDSGGKIKSPEKSDKLEKNESTSEQSNETPSQQSSDEDISSIAENIKNQIEKRPELISELGNKLHVDIVMKMLGFAVCKLKKENCQG